MHLFNMLPLLVTLATPVRSAGPTPGERYRGVVDAHPMPYPQDVTDCFGSFMCPLMINLGKMCQAAISRLNEVPPGMLWSSSGARTFVSCTAMWDCKDTETGHDAAYLISGFRSIYNEPSPCKRCGHHVDAYRNCSFTVDYCLSCVDSGTFLNPPPPVPTTSTPEPITSPNYSDGPVGDALIQHQDVPPSYVDGDGNILYSAAPDDPSPALSNSGPQQQPATSLWRNLSSRATPMSRSPLKSMGPGLDAILATSTFRTSAIAKTREERLGVQSSTSVAVKTP